MIPKKNEIFLLIKYDQLNFINRKNPDVTKVDE